MTSVPPYDVPPPVMPPPPPPAAPPGAPPQKSSGCVKWGAIGCGCLVLLVAGIAVVAVVLGFGLLKKSDVYREALHRAQSDPRVIATLGSPVESGWWVSGSVHVDSNTGGNAELNFPISGPKAKARVHAIATRENDQWKYETLRVTPEGGASIDLTTP